MAVWAQASLESRFRTCLALEKMRVPKKKSKTLRHFILKPGLGLEKRGSLLWRRLDERRNARKIFLETGRLAPGILQKSSSEGHMSWENDTFEKKIVDLTTLYFETRAGTWKNGTSFLKCRFSNSYAHFRNKVS